MKHKRRRADHSAPVKRRKMMNKPNGRDEKQYPAAKPSTSEVVVRKIPTDVDGLHPLTLRFLFCPPPNQPDTIATFPHNVISCLNSGDFQRLSELVNAHLDYNCDISMSYSQTKLNGNAFVRLFELFNEIHPDRIMSVHNAHSFGNRVAAKMYLKFTDCKPLYEAVARMVKEPLFADYFPPSRAVMLRRRLKTALKPDGERERLEAMLESDSDIVVYGCIQMVLTLDEVTNKALGMQLLCDFNAAHIANANCF
jgi:hypothetical protein